MTEKEIHAFNRRICREFVSTAIERLDLPVSLLEASVKHMNGDFKEPMVRPFQRRLLKQMKNIIRQLEDVKDRFI